MAALTQSAPSFSPAPAKAANKARAATKKLVVVLRLSPSSLSKISFVETPQRKVSRAKHVPAHAPAGESIEGDQQDSPSAQADASLAKQEHNGDSATPAAPGSKRKAASGLKSGTKRLASVTGDIEGGPKQRGKPGPKKKAKLWVDLQAFHAVFTQF